MKIKIMTLVFLFSAALFVPTPVGAGSAAPTGVAADPAKLEFVAPSFESPVYRILGSFAIEKGTSLIRSLDLNGSRPANILILRNGKPVDFAKPLGPGLYEIAMEYAWRSGKTYTLTVVYVDDTRSAAQTQKAAANPKAAPLKERKAVWTAAAPATGGIPEGYEEGFHAVFAVEEAAGIERTGELVALTVTAPKDEIGEDPLAVVDGGLGLTCQVLERKENQPLSSAASTHPVTTTIKLVVRVKAAAREKKLLVVLKGGPPSVPGPGPAVSGESPGRTVRSSRIVLSLDPQSGQLATIEFLKENLRLHNEKQGNVHGNPDVSVPGQLWDHASDWNPPASVAEKNGPLVYTNARKGPMSKVQDIFLEVKYALEQDAPYLLSETRMTARKDLGVVAVRNDQMVFAKRFFDTLVYKDPKEGLVQRPLLEAPDKPFGFVHAAPAEAEWVGLVNTFNRYGFFGIRLAELNSSLGAAGSFSHRAATYFYAPAEAEFVYWVRPLLSTWGDLSTNNRMLFLPEGSEFYEKNAYILLPMDEGTPAALDALARRLKNPLRVY